MRAATAAAAVAVAVVVASCGGASPAPDAGDRETPAATAAATSPAPSASPAVPVDRVARTLRAAARATVAACPCEFFVRVKEKESERKIELYGTYDPRARTTVLTGYDDPTTRLTIVDGVTWYRGPESGSAWVRLDFRALPGKARAGRGTLALTAAADPALAFAMAAGTYAPHLNASGKGWRTYSVSYDPAAATRAAGRSGALLRRLLGAPSPYGEFWLRTRYLSAVHYDVLAPGVTDRHGMSVYVQIWRRNASPAPGATPPAKAATVVVR